MLIPGLLIVLIVVVLITSLTREARGDAATSSVPAKTGQAVSTISDDRVTESSGLVLSIAHEGLAYTVNDSGNEPVVFAIEVSTGDVVGTTRIAGSMRDVEALSIDKTGMLWIADTGDNGRTRSSVDLYAFEEPGAGEHGTNARRFRLSFPDGAEDVETLLINPRTDEKFLVSKGFGGGTVYAVPKALSDAGDNDLKAVGPEVASLLTDGAFTPDGKYVALRDYGTMFVHDARSWKRLSATKLPEQKQGETLAMEPSGRSVLIGSEGKNSQLLRVDFEPTTARTATDSASGEDPGDGVSDGLSLVGVAWLLGALLIFAATCLVVVRRRR